MRAGPSNGPDEMAFRTPSCRHGCSTACPTVDPSRARGDTRRSAAHLVAVGSVDRAALPGASSSRPPNPRGQGRDFVPAGARTARPQHHRLAAAGVAGSRAGHAPRPRQRGRRAHPGPGLLPVWVLEERADALREGVPVSAPRCRGPYAESFAPISSLGCRGSNFSARSGRAEFSPTTWGWARRS